jgi:SAM-dependent methyltransferase
VDGLESLRRANFEKVLDVLEKIRPVEGLRLLEIGAAKGWFLEAARRRGAIVAGVEPETANASEARARGLRIDEALFPTAPRDRGPYDVIVFNDVFEHIPQPDQAIAYVEELLAPEGLLVLNLPSSTGVLFRLSRFLAGIGINGPYQRLWQKDMSSPHVSYFSPDNLRLLVEHASNMRQVVAGALPTVSRIGLYDRIASQDAGLPASLSYPAVWSLSFVLPLLPADVQVSIFVKGTQRVEANRKMLAK